tara:strand:- start:41 stop:733 length:693 start_codon:yes stop_codon:yes gene_type:complete
MSKDDFLGRWSKRKLEDEQENTDAAAAEVKDAPELASPDDAQVAMPEEGQGDLIALEGGEDVEGEEHQPHPAKDIDIEALDYGSDFTPFMDAKVPKALKRMALRKLWRSNPILANIDGLNDYDEDFSDAAAVFIDSAGKVISGAREQFWDDDQIAEGKDKIGEETGEEEVEQEVAEDDGSEVKDIDDGDVEDIDDFAEPEFVQSSDNSEPEEVDTKNAEKAVHDDKDGEV